MATLGRLRFPWGVTRGGRVENGALVLDVRLTRRGRAGLAVASAGAALMRLGWRIAGLPVERIDMEHDYERADMEASRRAIRGRPGRAGTRGPGSTRARGEEEGNDDVERSGTETDAD